jgi:hypothetical protein
LRAAGDPDRRAQRHTDWASARCPRTLTAGAHTLGEGAAPRREARRQPPVLPASATAREKVLASGDPEVALPAAVERPTPVLDVDVRATSCCTSPQTAAKPSLYVLRAPPDALVASSVRRSSLEKDRRSGDAGASSSFSAPRLGGSAPSGLAFDQVTTQAQVIAQVRPVRPARRRLDADCLRGHQAGKPTPAAGAPRESHRPPAGNRGPGRAVGDDAAAGPLHAKRQDQHWPRPLEMDFNVVGPGAMTRGGAGTLGPSRLAEARARGWRPRSNKPLPSSVPVWQLAASQRLAPPAPRTWVAFRDSLRGRIVPRPNNRSKLGGILEAPPGFEPGMEVLQISQGSLSC